MDNKEVIGIDHGFSQMKTVSSTFTSGVTEITTEPAFFDDVLEFEGKFYKVGGSRMEVRATKTETDEYYLLTLAAIAKELRKRGKRKADVVLAVGLPATRYGDEKQDFIDYLSRDREVCFRFEQYDYQINIIKVSVYPQCYAAVVDRIGTFGAKVVVVDIGSWTIDIIPVINRKPDDAKTNTIQQGLITCMRDINKQSVRKLGDEIDETDIQHYMIYGSSSLPKEYIEIMDKSLQEFTAMIYNSLREEKYNMKTTPFIFVGGGAVVMKNFGGYNQGNISYNLDVRANAKGYETLARISMRNGL